MTDTSIDDTSTDTALIDADDRTLVALTPSDMAPAQAELSSWCDRKIAAVKAEVADLEANLEIATTSGWKHTSVESTLRRTRKRVTYYEKIKAAVDAGYLIVPNFPIDVFAVRVSRAAPATRSSTYLHATGYREARPEALPEGYGRYVNGVQSVRTAHHNQPNPDGTIERKQYYISDAFVEEVEFPIRLVKPSVLAKTQRAMALRIFDELGTVVNEAGRDPIVVARLHDPRGNGRVATFYIAWWLDTASL